MSYPGSHGRPPGRRNDRTMAQIHAVEDSGITPLDYLVSVYRDKSKPIEFRMAAAKAAAPYVHPRLATIELKPIRQVKAVRELSNEELEAFIAESHPNWASEVEGAT